MPHKHDLFLGHLTQLEKDKGMNSVLECKCGFRLANVNDLTTEELSKDKRILSSFFWIIEKSGHKIGV
jgi:hypothetical protein